MSISEFIILTTLIMACMITIYGQKIKWPITPVLEITATVIWGSVVSVTKIPEIQGYDWQPIVGAVPGIIIGLIIYAITRKRSRI